ncbi:MAG: response regulator [Patescibacteria group bacterium]
MDTPKTILLVEDDVFLRDLLAKKVGLEGFDIISASSGADAFSKCGDVVPSLVLLDLLLPDMNGLEVLKRFREDERLKDVPVLILSNIDQEADKIEAKRLGVEGFMVKSDVLPQEIINKIREIFSL